MILLCVRVFARLHVWSCRTMIKFRAAADRLRYRGCVTSDRRFTNNLTRVAPRNPFAAWASEIATTEPIKSIIRFVEPQAAAESVGDALERHEAAQDPARLVCWRSASESPRW